MYTGLGQTECGPLGEGFEVECPKKGGPGDMLPPISCGPVDPRLAAAFDIECAEDLPPNYQAEYQKRAGVLWGGGAVSPGGLNLPKTQADLNAWFRKNQTPILVAAGGLVLLSLFTGKRRR